MAAAPGTIGIAAAVAPPPVEPLGGLNTTGIKNVWGEQGYSGANTSAGTGEATFSDAAPPAGEVAAAKRPWDYDSDQVAKAAAALEASPEESSAATSSPSSGGYGIRRSSNPRAGHGNIVEGQCLSVVCSVLHRAVALFVHVCVLPFSFRLACWHQQRKSHAS